MLNTGAFFVRASEWSWNYLERIWGTEDSVWSNHPWWENAAFTWNFLKDNAAKFKLEDHVSWIRVQGGGGGGGIADDVGADDMLTIYPPEVRLAQQAKFNSYHPITSRFLHDMWEDGKFVLAFNGVLSGSSAAVITVLYANYYRLACKLNDVEDQCVTVKDDEGGMPPGLADNDVEKGVRR